MELKSRPDPDISSTISITGKTNKVQISEQNIVENNRHTSKFGFKNQAYKDVLRGKKNSFSSESYASENEDKLTEKPQ